MGMVEENELVRTLRNHKGLNGLQMWRMRDEAASRIAALEVQLADMEVALSSTGAMKAIYPSASATEVDPDGAFERAYAEVAGVQLTEPTPPESTPPAPKVTREGVKVVGVLNEGQYAVFHSAFPPHFWDGEKMVRIDLTAAQDEED